MQAPAAPDPPDDLSDADWDALFHAVEARLRDAVNEPLAQRIKMLPPDAPELVQTIVLECVDALDQLHRALTHERQQRDQRTGPDHGV